MPYPSTTSAAARSPEQDFKEKLHGEGRAVAEKLGALLADPSLKTNELERRPDVIESRAKLKEIAGGFSDPSVAEHSAEVLKRYEDRARIEAVAKHASDLAFVAEEAKGVHRNQDSEHADLKLDSYLQSQEALFQRHAGIKGEIISALVETRSRVRDSMERAVKVSSELHQALDGWNNTKVFDAKLKSLTTAERGWAKQAFQIAHKQSLQSWVEANYWGADETVRVARLNSSGASAGDLRARLKTSQLDAAVKVSGLPLLTERLLTGKGVELLADEPRQQKALVGVAKIAAQLELGMQSQDPLAVVISALDGRSEIQRQAISNSFKTLSGKDLAEVFTPRLSAEEIASFRGMQKGLGSKLSTEQKQLFSQLTSSIDKGFGSREFGLLQQLGKSLNGVLDAKSYEAFTQLQASYEVRVKEVQVVESLIKHGDCLKADLHLVLAQRAAIIGQEEGLLAARSTSASGESKQDLEAAFQKTVAAYLQDYPESVAQLQQLRVETATNTQMSSVQARLLILQTECGREVGLPAIFKNEAHVRSLVKQIAEYRRTQKNILVSNPEVDQALLAAEQRKFEEGKLFSKNVYKSVMELNTGVCGHLGCFGTLEDVTYSALKGRTPEEIRAIEKLYRRRYNRDLKTDLEGDFSGAEKDKVVALYESKIGQALAADAYLNLTDYWFYPDTAKLKGNAREYAELAQYEKQAFDSRFNERYVPLLNKMFERTASQSNSGGAEGYLGSKQVAAAKVASFREAISASLDADSSRIVLAIQDQDIELEKVAELHVMLERTNNPETEIGKLLQGLANKDGSLNGSRISSFTARYEKEYGVSLNKHLRRELGGNELNWVLSLIETGPEASREKADAYKLRYALERVLSSTDRELAAETLEITETLRVLPETDPRRQQALTARASQNKRIGAELAKQGVSLGKLIESAFSDSRAACMRARYEDGVLSDAQAIVDASGEGTDTTDEEMLKARTAGKTRAQLAVMNEEFKNFVAEHRLGAYNGYDIYSTVRSETSGSDYFDIKENLQGRPETREAKIAAAVRRREFEGSGLMNNKLVRFAALGSTGLMEIDPIGLHKLDKLITDMQRFDQEHREKSDANEKLFNALYEEYEQASGVVRQDKEDLAGLVTTVGTTVVVVGVGIATGGTATPLLVTVLSVGGASIGTKTVLKYAIRGGADYSWGELARDGGFAVIDGVTMYGGTRGAQLLTRSFTPEILLAKAAVAAGDVGISGGASEFSAGALQGAFTADWSDPNAAFGSMLYQAGIRGVTGLASAGAMKGVGLGAGLLKSKGPVRGEFEFFSQTEEALALLEISTPDAAGHIASQEEIVAKAQTLLAKRPADAPPDWGAEIEAAVDFLAQVKRAPEGDAFLMDFSSAAEIARTTDLVTLTEARRAAAMQLNSAPVVAPVVPPAALIASPTVVAPVVATAPPTAPIAPPTVVAPVVATVPPAAPIASPTVVGPVIAPVPPVAPIAPPTVVAPGVTTAPPVSPIASPSVGAARPPVRRTVVNPPPAPTTVSGGPSAPAVSPTTGTAGGGTNIGPSSTISSGTPVDSTTISVGNAPQTPPASPARSASRTRTTSRDGSDGTSFKTRGEYLNDAATALEVLGYEAPIGLDIVVPPQDELIARAKRLLETGSERLDLNARRRTEAAVEFLAQVERQADGTIGPTPNTVLHNTDNLTVIRENIQTPVPVAMQNASRDLTAARQLLGIRPGEVLSGDALASRTQTAIRANPSQEAEILGARDFYSSAVGDSSTGPMSIEKLPRLSKLQTLHQASVDARIECVEFETKLGLRNAADTEPPVYTEGELEYRYLQRRVELEANGSAAEISALDEAFKKAKAFKKASAQVPPPQESRLSEEVDTAIRALKRKQAPEEGTILGEGQRVTSMDAKNIRVAEQQKLREIAESLRAVDEELQVARTRGANPEALLNRKAALEGDRIKAEEAAAFLRRLSSGGTLYVALLPKNFKGSLTEDIAKAWALTTEPFRAKTMLGFDAPSPAKDFRSIVRRTYDFLGRRYYNVTSRDAPPSSSLTIRFLSELKAHPERRAELMAAHDYHRELLARTTLAEAEAKSLSKASVDAAKQELKELGVGTADKLVSLAYRTTAYRTKYEAFEVLGIEIKDPLREPVVTRAQVESAARRRLENCGKPEGSPGAHQYSRAQVEGSMDALIGLNVVARNAPDFARVQLFRRLVVPLDAIYFARRVFRRLAPESFEPPLQPQASNQRVESLASQAPADPKRRAANNGKKAKLAKEPSFRPRVSAKEPPKEFDVYVEQRLNDRQELGYGPDDPIQSRADVASRFRARDGSVLLDETRKTELAAARDRLLVGFTARPSMGSIAWRGATAASFSLFHYYGLKPVLYRMAVAENDPSTYRLGRVAIDQVSKVSSAAERLGRLYKNIFSAPNDPILGPGENLLDTPNGDSTPTDPSSSNSPPIPNAPQKERRARYGQTTTNRSPSNRSSLDAQSATPENTTWVSNSGVSREASSRLAQLDVPGRLSKDQRDRFSNLVLVKETKLS